MNYLEIIDCIYSVIFSIIIILTLHAVFFAILGIFGKKRFPKAKEYHKYGLIIPARNEENVVGNLIKSIYQNKYPQDKLQVFVVAHNCTDNTAQVCRELGATVYEYNNPDECTMGYAFRYLFSQIEKDYGTQNYDGFFILNADNVLSENFIEKMNDAFDSCNGERVITSFRNSKNFGTNVISGCYGLFFIAGCLFSFKGRTICNCSARVSGTGYVINSKLVQNGWEYVTLTEDWEFSADQVIKGQKILYCDDAVFYDEQPTTFKVMWRQRLRWSKGTLLVFVSKTKQLLKNLFSLRRNNIDKMSTYDTAFNIFPLCLTSLFLGIIYFIAMLFAPLFGISIGVAMLACLSRLLYTLSATLALCWITAIIIFIIERKRIKGVSFKKKILIGLFWPVFVLIQFPIDLVALFSKNLVWKTIPHTDTTSIEQLQESDDIDKSYVVSEQPMADITIEESQQETNINNN